MQFSSAKINKQMQAHTLAHTRQASVANENARARIQFVEKKMVLDEWPRGRIACCWVRLWFSLLPVYLRFSQLALLALAPPHFRPFSADFSIRGSGGSGPEGNASEQTKQILRAGRGVLGKRRRLAQWSRFRSRFRLCGKAEKQKSRKAEKQRECLGLDQKLAQPEVD